jgi:hypothetical protein
MAITSWANDLDLYILDITNFNATDLFGRTVSNMEQSLNPIS